VDVGGFCSLQLNFGMCCCSSSLTRPGDLVKSSGDLVQQPWGSSGPSRALLGGAGIEGKRRLLIKALLAQELPSAN